jgi:hypothetical protein
MLHWTTDDWQHSTDTQSTSTRAGIDFVDLPLPDRETTIRFTFFWVDENRWEGKDYAIELQSRPQPSEHARPRKKPDGLQKDAFRGTTAL